MYSFKLEKVSRDNEPEPTSLIINIVDNLFGVTTILELKMVYTTFGLVSKGNGKEKVVGAKDGCTAGDGDGERRKRTRKEKETKRLNMVVN